MKKVLILLAAVCVASAMAENVVLKTIDFETSEGYNTGAIKGQQGWTWDYSTDDDNVIINDSTVAASGSQYLSLGDAGGDARCRSTFDISSSFEAGNKLRISWYSAGKSGKTHYAKFHNIGTTGEKYDVEMFELQIYGGTVALNVSKEDKSGTQGIMKYGLANPTDFHEVSVVVDPATKTIKEYTFDGEVLFDGSTTLYYKNEASGQKKAGQGGSLIDGVRLQGGGAFDGFKVEMVPEPAVFGLLALLGLFVARKQR